MIFPNMSAPAKQKAASVQLLQCWGPLVGCHSVPPPLAICDHMSNEKVRLGLQPEDIRSILVGRRGGRPLRGPRVCDGCMLTFEQKQKT